MKTVKNSMADAERKEWSIAKIVMGVVTILLFLMSYQNLFHTNLFYWHKQAGSVAGGFGILFYALSILCLWIEPWLSAKTQNESLWYIVWFAGIAAGLVVSCGFNFSLP